MLMETYIVYQMIVNSKKIDGNISNILMSTLVRKVEANSKEEAIGKFAIMSNKIEAIQKLDIQCDKLSELLSL